MTDARGLCMASPLTEERWVVVVDDDLLVRKSLARVLTSHGYSVLAFTSADAFFQHPLPDTIGCVLLDLGIPGSNGLDVQQAMLRSGRAMPIVFLSAHGDVPAAVRAMRAGAVDVLVKPIGVPELLDALVRAESRGEELRRERRTERETMERLNRLTRREREVCELVACGLLNKQIAYELGTSEKTVKVHRGRAMHKLEVDSVATLVRLLSHRVPERKVS